MWQEQSERQANEDDRDDKSQGHDEQVKFWRSLKNKESVLRCAHTAGSIWHVFVLRSSMNNHLQEVFP